MAAYLSRVEADIHVEHSPSELVMATVNARLDMHITEASRDALERVHLALLNQDYKTMFLVLAEMCGDDVPGDSLPEVVGQPTTRRRGRRITV